MGDLYCSNLKALYAYDWKLFSQGYIMIYPWFPGIYLDISLQLLQAGIYWKYIPVASFDLRC